MRSTPALLAVLVAALVGLSLGFLGARLFDAPTASPSEAPTAIAPGPREDGVRARERGATSLAGESGTVRSVAAPVTASPVPSDAALERAVQRVAAPEVVAGELSGSLTVRALDRRGAGVAGVQVEVERRDDGPRVEDAQELWGERAEPQELDGFLLERAREWAERRARTARARTDASGTAVLAGLDPDAVYEVSASAAAATVTALDEARRARAGDRVRFLVEGLARVDLVVQREDGEPVEQAVLELREDGRVRRVAWVVPSTPVYLSGPSARVRAYAGLPGEGELRHAVDEGLEAALASPELPVRPADGEAGPVVLRLAPRAGVRGEVVAGSDLGGLDDDLRVRLVPVPPGAGFDPDALAGSDRSVRPLDGRFAFLDLDAGTWAVGVTGRNGVALAHELVEVAGGLAEVRLEVDALAGLELLVVRASGPDGLPVLPDRVRIEVRGERSNVNRTLAPVTRELDASTYLLVPSELEPRGGGSASITLVAEHRRYGEVSVPLEADQREVDVRFEEPVSIAVLVEGADGAGVAGRLDVTLRRAGTSGLVEDPFGGRSGVVNVRGARQRGNGALQVPRDGRVRADGLAPDTYEVLLSVRNGWSGTVVESREVDARSGEVEVVFAAPVLHAQRVVAPELEEGTWLWLTLVDDDAGESRGRNPFEGGASAAVDENGVARFEGLLAGRYRIGAQGVSNTLDVDVPSADVLFEVRRHDALSVTVSDVEGELYRAGLRSGDLVVAVSGVEAGDGRAMSTEITRGDAGLDLRLTVLRDGSELSVTLPASTGPARDLGGRLRLAFRP